MDYFTVPFQVPTSEPSVNRQGAPVIALGRSPGPQSPRHDSLSAAEAGFVYLDPASVDADLDLYLVGGQLHRLPVAG